MIPEYKGRIQHKHDTTENWNKAANFIPLQGEIIIYTDTNKLKIGNGINTVSELAYISDYKVIKTISENQTFVLTHDTLPGKYIIYPNVTIKTSDDKTIVKTANIITEMEIIQLSEYEFIVSFPKGLQYYRLSSVITAGALTFRCSFGTFEGMWDCGLTNITEQWANIVGLHPTDFVSDEDGVHGIKFTKDGKVKIKDENEVWTTVVNPYKTYTAIIDEEETDPDLAVSYADDAKDMEAKSEKWLETDIFKDIRPCVFRDGEVQCYLDPNDYTQQIKNTDPMFYSENEIKLDGKCAYTEIIQAEEAALYDRDGNSLPIGIENSNWGIGYGVQGGGQAHDQDRKESITVCYRGDGYMEYKFNVPVAGDYYWIIKFSSQVSNAVRQQEFSINDGKHQVITFPQKGKQWLDANTYWEQTDTKYIYQFMRQCIKLTQGENSIKVYTPADYWSDTSIVATIEIDYMALTSIDTPDITSGIDKEVLSPYFLKENKFPITTGGITTGTLENNNDCAAQVLSFKVIENGTSNQEAEHAINLGGNRDGSNILMNKPINDYPYLRVYYNCFKAGTSNSDICAYVYLKNGTITRIWGKNPAINNSGQFSYFDIDLLSGWTGGEMSGQGYTLNDIDFTKPLVGLQIKPWYSQVRNVGEYFNIIGLAFYAEEYYEDIVPSYFNGDVMIEIPKMGYRFKRVKNNVHVSVTRDPDVPGFSYDAFLRGDRLNDYIYISAYRACSDKNKYNRSLSGKSSSQFTLAYPDNKYTPYIFDAKFKNNYSFLMYFPYVLIACLYLLYYKSIDCSTLIKHTSKATSGSLNTSGMIYKDDETGANKFIGIENLTLKVGSPILIDGLYTCYLTEYMADVYCCRKNIPYSYEKVGSLERNIGYKKSIYGENILAFFSSEVGGSDSTYYKVRTWNSSNSTIIPISFICPNKDGGILGYHTNREIGYKCGYLMYSAE